jgi:flavin reductase (DIM6/NTAB) family NADH-FMN oxidoreductase RutF
MAKQVWKGGTLLNPTPAVLVSCGTIEKPNAFTVGWTGIVCTHPARTYISVRPSRHSYGLIKESGEFVINLTTSKLIDAVDKCGVFTGKNKDKFNMCGITAEASSKVSAPSIKESPICLECKVFKVIPLGTHDMFLADIVAVRVDEELLDEKGSLSLEKAGILAYSHGKYYELKKPLASLGFAVKKKHKGMGNKKNAR